MERDEKELQEKYEKLQKINRQIIKKHLEHDRIGKEKKEADKRKLKKLRRHEARRGADGDIIKSNVTNNESGKIKCPHGVIQEYNGIAVADSKNQVIIAYGNVAEWQYFSEMLEKLNVGIQRITDEKNHLTKN